MSVFTKRAQNFVHDTMINMAGRSFGENAARGAGWGSLSGAVLGAAGGEMYGDRDYHTLGGIGIGASLGALGGVGFAYGFKPRANQYTRGLQKRYAGLEEAFKEKDAMLLEKVDWITDHPDYVKGMSLATNNFNKDMMDMVYNYNRGNIDLGLNKSISTRDELNSVYRFQPKAITV